jgi:hypothetical protein
MDVALRMIKFPYMLGVFYHNRDMNKNGAKPCIVKITTVSRAFISEYTKLHHNESRL